MATKLRLLYERLRGSTARHATDTQDANNAANSSDMRSHSIQGNRLTLDVDRPIKTYRDLFSAASMLTETEPPDIQPNYPGWLKRFYDLSIARKHLLGLLTSKVIAGASLIMAGTFLVFVSERNQLLNQAQAELAVTERIYNLKIDEVKTGFPKQTGETAIDVSIPQDILAIFKNGYSAIYQYQEDGSFTLATSLDVEGNSAIAQAVPDRMLNRQTLLEEAVAIPGQIVSRRDQVDDRTYTLAAKAIESFDGGATVLVRGTAETALNRLIGNSLKLQLLVLLTALAIDLGVVRLWGQSILYPLKNLQRSVQSFGIGNRRARAQVLANDEVGRIAKVFNQLADTLTQSEIVLQQQAERDSQAAVYSSLTLDLTTRIRQSLDESTILNTTVDGLLQVLKVDRVLIYQFNHTYEVANVIAESIEGEWPSVLGSQIIDPSIAAIAAQYKARRVTFVEDCEQTDAAHGYRAALANLTVKAHMTAPLFLGNELVGLICAHRYSLPRKWQPGEIDLMQQIAVQAGQALSQAKSLQRQQQAAARGQQLTEIISQMRQGLNEAQIHRAAVNGTRQVLKTDRVFVCWFDPTWRGLFIIESVAPGWPAVLGGDIRELWNPDNDIDHYRQGNVTAIANIAEAGLPEGCLEQLAPYHVRANLVAPILVEGRLAGLLVTHQCSGPRNWDSLDVDFCRQVASQLGFALEQARLFARIQALSEERSGKQQILQWQLVQLLSGVEGAAQGDLTVRADVTLSELGIVADFFNTIVESLHQIVIQVKHSIEQVTVAIGANKGAIQTLADDAILQAEGVTYTLSAIASMTRSTEQVASYAQQTATMATRTANRAETSARAMELTEHSIVKLREMIGGATAKVKRLGESSSQIAKAVVSIEHIAEQTHLLAINAGIEASAAGQEGCSIATLSEEVGDLTSRSVRATQDIEQLVAAIQQETAEAVEAMEQSTAEMAVGARFVEDAKYNLERILEVSQQIDHMVQSVFEATTSQVEVSDTLTQLMQDVAQVSERTAESAYRIADAQQQAVEVTHALEASVGRFKTNES
ncbi:MAG: GAF domain-containing protein [Leptolyngbyaceae cyanobacterium]